MNLTGLIKRGSNKSTDDGGDHKTQTGEDSSKLD